MLRNQQSNAISPEELDIIDTKNDKSSNNQKHQKRMFCYFLILNEKCLSVCTTELCNLILFRDAGKLPF